MNSNTSPASTLKWILVPALLSLGVTVLRLVGELNQWAPALFSREGGGGGALVGISWLPPVFGIYFAVRLTRAGLGPRSRAAAVGAAVAGTLVAFGSFAGILSLKLPVYATMVTINLAAAAGGAIAAVGWPSLAKVLFAYALAARIPVAILMLVAMFNQWGTHYEKGPPGFPEMGVLATWAWIGLLPQLVLWVGFTLFAGSLFGSLAALAVRRRA